MTLADEIHTLKGKIEDLRERQRREDLAAADTMLKNAAKRLRGARPVSRAHVNNCVHSISYQMGHIRFSHSVAKAFVDDRNYILVDRFEVEGWAKFFPTPEAMTTALLEDLDQQAEILREKREALMRLQESFE